MQIEPQALAEILNIVRDNLPKTAGDKKSFANLVGSSLSLILAEIIISHKGLVLIIAPDSRIADKIQLETQFFLNEKENDNSNKIPVSIFPDWETLPYDNFSPHQDIISDRLTTLYQLSNQSLKHGAIILPINTLMHRLSPPSYLFQNTLLMKKGDKIDLPEFRLRLEQSGYHLVSQVMEHGDYAVRGSIIDLYPMGSNLPYRIDLFADEIDTLRTFDVESQRSLEKVEEIRLLPAREYPLTKEKISEFRTRWRDKFEGDPRHSALYTDVSQGIKAPGLEYYLPLFFEQLTNFFEYCPANTLVIKLNDLETKALEFWEEIKARYDRYGHDRLRPILEPKAIFLEPNEIFAQIKKYPQIQLDCFPPHFARGRNDRGKFQLPFQELPDLTIASRHEKPLHKLEEFLNQFSGVATFVAESAGRREVLKELLNNHIPSPNIIIAPLDQGFRTTDFAFITESELLGKRVKEQRTQRQKQTSTDMEIRNLVELSPGVPVVHIDYGIGRYLGLTHLTLSQTEGEFVTLEYADGAKLYVPVSSLHLISRYSGAEIENAPLHRLGSAEWEKTKRKVLEDTHDVAAELLAVYAEREAKSGFSFQKPDEHYDVFSAEFPFEETPDQKKAIDDVLKDLTSSKPMDRVVCGEVGFGKTEVAIRASFLAVQSAKQVAILVPTTLLAEQHFQTFTDRFAGFPFRVEVMSRFQNKKEQQNVIEGLKEGKVDIVIGTHKLLQDDVQFKSLGLLIIDEEHRFGVKQKEKFKSFRSEVDILTLTATPIPRTLNMAMSGIRDLSIIATPPLRRLSIKTFVRERQGALIQEAIMRELHRGGQIYFLHNAVETIENTALELQNWVPQARVAIAHGQMPERELEQVMTDFYHRRYNVLVCTTIIETGIDIPTANTIIIDRADKFGLAQLHQLRGRVGRSHHQAYAFCLIPQHTKITTDAAKRLEALTQLEELGSGFTLAIQDLEIRGAGELLGEEQSGNIQSIGYSLYMELLDQAVNTLKQGKTLSFNLNLKKGADIDLQIPNFIPESYIPDVHTRLILYKRLNNAKTLEVLQELNSEMIDRFGLLPDQTKNLFKIMEIKLKAQSLGVVKIEAGPKGARLEFNENPQVDPGKIIQLIQTEHQIYSLEGPQKLRLKKELPTKDIRIQEILKLISYLKAS